MESMRVKRDAAHLTLLQGGVTTGTTSASPFRGPRPVPRLRLVRPTSEQLSPAAKSLLSWLDANTYAATPDLSLRRDIDLLRIDAAARLAHDANAAVRDRARAGEAS